MLGAVCMYAVCVVYPCALQSNEQEKTNKQSMIESKSVCRAAHQNKKKK